MALTSVIHCQVDAEPESFYQADMANPKLHFAVNLSFEVIDTKPDLSTLKANEAYAEGLFDDFLAKAVTQLSLWRYELVDNSGNLYLQNPQILAPISATPQASAFQLAAWLDAEASTARASADDPDKVRFWTSLAAVDTALDQPVDVKDAGAAARLRSVQSWNAPVGHVYNLTHVIWVPVSSVATYAAVVIPYFGQNEPPAPLSVTNPDADPTNPLRLVEIVYAPVDGVSPTVRASVIPSGSHSLDPSIIDPSIGPDGYLFVEPDAENMRRLLQWFEGRAASLLSANNALSARRPEDEKRFAQILGLWSIKTIVNGSVVVTWYWDHLMWFAVARLCAALDAPLSAMLKPVLDPDFSKRDHKPQLTFDAISEGPLIGPLVSAIRDRFDDRASDGGGPFFSSKDAEPASICAAIRAVLRDRCPLVAGDPDKKLQLADALRLATALRSVFDLPDALSAPAKVGDDRQLLSAMLAAYATFVTSTSSLKDDARKVSAPATDYCSALAGDCFLTIARLVSELEQSLLDEKGAERAIVRILLSVEYDGDTFAKLVAKNLSGAPAEAVQAISDAWVTYQGLLDGPFNGAEAVRQAASETAVKSLLTYSIKRASKPYRVSPSQYLADVAKNGAYYERRFLDGTQAAQCFDPILLAFVKPPLDLLAGSNDIQYLRGILHEAYTDALAPIDGLDDPNARFIPDPAPHPLAIQIAKDIDGTQIDAFATAFNGIALAIRRLDGGKDRWAHANLADLKWHWPPDGTTYPEVAVSNAIHPMLPAVTDGRGPMFIDYDGVPFAASVDPLSAVDNGYATADPRKPFYRHEAHDYADDDPFAKLARLAYGRTFESFAFITSNAGSMPIDLQYTDANPWLPKADFDASKLDSKFIGRTDCQRRTAIAQAAIKETTESKSSRPDGVWPLSEDYPRIVLVAEKNVAGRRDIFRSADGVGTMELPTAMQKAVWPLAKVRLAGKPSTLTLTYFDRTALGPDDTGSAPSIDIDLSSFTSGEIASIEVAIAAPIAAASAIPVLPYLFFVSVNGAEVGRKTFVPSDRLGWLRLTLKTDDAAALSFADAAGQKPDNVGAPLFILAPAVGDPWRLFPDKRTFSIATPRVGYLDFVRWLSNGDLSARILPGRELDKDDDPAAKFLAALRFAYDLRQLNDDLAAALANLPDPAVIAIRFELATTDTLTDDKPSAATTQVALVDLPSDPQKTLLNAFIENWSKKWVPPGDTDLGVLAKHLLETVLQPLDRQFQLALTITAGASFSIKSKERAVDARLPAGMAARLMLDTLVYAQDFYPQGKYPAVLHPGLKQFVARVVGPDTTWPFAFPAAALRFEVMVDAIDQVAREDWTDLARVAIAARPLQRARRYDLVAGGEQPDLWRLIGEVDVTTQRWRTTGRPIYHHVNPAECLEPGADPSAAALPLLIDTSLAQFESDAFFDRPDIDAHSITQKLLPLPSATVLQEQPWEAPSATYFRHRFTLRSRYAGALTQLGKRQVDAWPAKPLTEPNTAANRAGHWTKRVAMLAELSSVPLPTPQLRALIPLTTSASGSNGALPAPPLAAILQEPPFARGGLADRIAAEIKSGFGYGFTADNKPVQIQDSRKEAGPTPYLDYQPLKAELSRGLALIAEGPMGLTFDDVDAAAPAFPNAMLNLRPLSLAGEDQLLEELFLGVSMRRYFDRNWIVGPETQNASVDWIDAETCWWIDLGVPTEWKADVEIRMHVEGGAEKGENLLVFTRKTDSPVRDGAFAAKVSTAAIDGYKSTNDPVELVRADYAQVQRVSVLHQPIASGRYSATIFVETPRSDIAKGRDNAPLALASVEWSPPRLDQTSVQPDTTVRKVTLSLGDGATATETSASQTTILEWTRTNRDFEMVDVAASKETRWPEVSRLNVRDLVGGLTGDHRQVSIYKRGAADPLWLASSTLHRRFPLHAHRHLAFLTTRYLKEMGRATEIFCRTALAFDKAPDLIRPDGSLEQGIFQPPERSLRVVEFETPAQILCNGAYDMMPARFRSAYFDLISTGFSYTPDTTIPSKGMKASSTLNRSLRFFVRPVGAIEHLAALKDLTISLSLPAKSDSDKPKPSQFKISIKSAAANKPTVGVIMAISIAKTDAGLATPDVTFALLRADGSLNEGVAATVTGEALQVPQPDALTPGLIMELNATGGVGEFWADVSLLHSRRGSQTAPFDFDWLFSQASDRDPVAAVNPGGLTTMVEAQARLISVSPPIPIVRH